MNKIQGPDAEQSATYTTCFYIQASAKFQMPWLLHSGYKGPEQDGAQGRTGVICAVTTELSRSS